MTHTVPTHRLAPIRETLRVLDGVKKVVLTTHLNADGDGAGSEIALATFLRERGVEAWIVNPTPFPKLFRFMLPDDGSKKRRTLRISCSTFSKLVCARCSFQILKVQVFVRSMSPCTHADLPYAQSYVS